MDAEDAEAFGAVDEGEPGGEGAAVVLGDAQGLGAVGGSCGGGFDGEGGEFLVEGDEVVLLEVDEVDGGVFEADAGGVVVDDAGDVVGAAGVGVLDEALE
ncbi:hypothetical protein ACQEU5_21870 [Marinactinospora thermotolerans]|uniref:hypothetical protein n=1 Tax=Marinactinospora thermotolerans TaxID=531310 RepID=UPI003D8A700D